MMGFADSGIHRIPLRGTLTKIGNIKNLESTTDNLWRSANLEIPYKIDELNEVLLVLDFP